MILYQGRLLAWLSPSERTLLSFVDAARIPDEALRQRCGQRLAGALVELLHAPLSRRKAMLIEKIDDGPAHAHPFAEALVAVGFRRTHDGLLRARDRGYDPSSPATAEAVVGVVHRSPR